MRILVISDTHRKLENLEYLLKHIGPVDMLIHLGDVEGQELIIQDMVSCPFYVIAGNNDYFSVLPREMELTIAGKKVLLTHGHRYLVSQGIERVTEEAVARGAEIVMFGHTHKPLVHVGSEVTALSPGSLSYPRQNGRKPSYLMITVDAAGKFHYQIHYIDPAQEQV